MISTEDQKRIFAGVSEALTHWSNDARVERSLKFLYLTVKAKGEGVLAPVRDLIRAQVSELCRQDNETGRALKMRFWDGEVLQAVAQELNVSIATAKRKCDHGVERVSEMICRAEADCREQFVHSSLATLPPPSYGNLYGQASTLDLLAEQLLMEGAPWVIALVGLGGTGKTAVTDAVVRRLLPTLRFERVVWLRSDLKEGSGLLPASALVERLGATLARQLIGEGSKGSTIASSLEQSRAVWYALKAKPHLIVIDNLESESETLVLMDLLSGLANPSKFLVTTRNYQVNQSGVYHITLGDLSREAARSLFLEQLRISGPSKPPAEPAEQERLVDAVFETVGGHPLAVKLIARMLDALPLPAILSDFKKGHSLSRNDVYGPIFERAWQIISAESRHVLEVIGASGDQSIDPEAIITRTSLSEDAVWAAIRELTHRSLIEPRGTLTHKRYGSHRLTQRFLEARSVVLQGDSANVPNG